MQNGSRYTIMGVLILAVVAVGSELLDIFLLYFCFRSHIDRAIISDLSSSFSKQSSTARATVETLMMLVMLS